jgi:SAM-dependent methyltransferase
MRAYDLASLSKDALVLEVASGADPLFRSDVLMDKYPIQSTKHRVDRQPIKTDGRPFVVGDVYDLPFRNRSFDVIVARHVLEHLSEPKRFIAEAQRVAKRVFIKTPSPFTELMHGGFNRPGDLGWLHYGRGSPGHLWYVVAADHKLVMVAKSQDLFSIYALFGYFVHHNTRYNRNRFFRQHPDWVETALFAADIEIETLGTPETTSEEPVDIDALSVVLPNLNPGSPVRRIARRMVRRAFATRRRFDLYDLLACPRCKRSIDRDLNCESCGRYPSAASIPILLPRWEGPNLHGPA